MERKASPPPSSSSMANSTLFLISIITIVALSCSLSQADVSKVANFDDSFNKTCPESHFAASADGQKWFLRLDKNSGCGFQTKNKYRFGWFSMRLKLVAGDSAGVVTAFFMCSDIDLGPTRDELDFEFLGNRTGQPYIVQTNVYKNGTGNREQRHFLWFDPTEDYHRYSILWNIHQILFMVDEVPLRVYKNANYTNNFFPISQPMYLFSSIWNADDWATRGGLDKINWTNAPFVSSYADFVVDACQWEDPYPACVSTTTENWWDQYPAWHLTENQKMDYAWVNRNLVVYSYCQDKERFQKANEPMPEECGLSPWD